MTGPMEALRDWLVRGVKWGDGAAPVILNHDLDNHEGNVFSSGFLVTGIADGTQINMIMWNPNGIDGKEAHSTLAAILGGRGYGILYDATEILTTGTVAGITRLNRVRERQDVLPPSQWMIAGNAAITNIGNQIGERYIPGSTGANPNAGRAAGTTRSGYAWILDPSNVYLMVLLNDSGAIVPGQMLIEWSEHDQDAFGSEG